MSVDPAVQSALDQIVMLNGDDTPQSLALGEQVAREVSARPRVNGPIPSGRVRAVIELPADQLELLADPVISLLSVEEAP